MKVHIVTPSYTGIPVPAYMQAVRKVIDLAGEHDMTIEATILPNCSILPLARSKLAAIALAGKADKIVFIDDDMSFRPEDFFAVVTSDHDIVSLPYWCGKTTLSYYASEMLPPPGQQFFDIISNGFGLMSIARSVFRAIEKDCAVIRDKDFRDVHGVAVESKLRNYFQYKVVEGEFHGEDVNFCRLAGSYGIENKLYCNAVTTHHKQGGALVLDFQRLVESVHAAVIL